MGAAKAVRVAAAAVAFDGCPSVGPTLSPLELAIHGDCRLGHCQGHGGARGARVPQVPPDPGPRYTSCSAGRACIPYVVMYVVGPMGLYSGPFPPSLGRVPCMGPSFSRVA